MALREGTDCAHARNQLSGGLDGSPSAGAGASTFAPLEEAVRWDSAPSMLCSRVSIACSCVASELMAASICAVPAPSAPTGPPPAGAAAAGAAVPACALPAAPVPFAAVPAVAGAAVLAGVAAVFVSVAAPLPEPWRN